MSAHTMALSCFIDGSYQNLTADMFGDPLVVKITRGLTEDGSLRPSRIEWRMNNVDDRYRPTNPASTLYRKFARGMRVGLGSEGQTRAVGEASSFQPDQDPEFAVGPPARGRRWVDCVAEGLLARVTGWSEPVRSPIQQVYSSIGSSRGYWTLEDGRNATQLSNQVAGGQPGYLVGATPAADSGPPGANTAVASTGTSRMGGNFTSMSATAGWQITFAMKLPSSAVLTSTPTNAFQFTTSNGLTFFWDMKDTGYRMRVVAADGTVMTDSPVNYGTGVDPKKWIVTRFRVSASAGTVSIEVSWYPQDGAVLYGFTPTFSGTMGALRTWRQASSAPIDGALYSHVLGISDIGADLLSAQITRAFNAYLGELAGTRFTRLLTQAGVFNSIVGSASTTWPMGRQKSDTIINQLKEIMATENGLIYDRDDVAGIQLRTRASMINQTPVLTLQYPGDITPPLVEAVDNLDITNQFTVSQRDGGEATATLTTGPLGTGQLPLRKGSADVNVADESQLPSLAGYGLASGTIDAPRYPTIVIDFEVVSAAIAAAANAVNEGDLIVLKGRTPEDLFLIMLGATETIQLDRRVITFTCVPADVFKVGVYGASTSRYDVAASTLAAAATAAATSLSLTGAGPYDVWSTSTPYDLNIAGERVTVTAMTAPAGTGPYTQTATVTRAVNGVSKAQVIGEEVHIADRDTTRAGRVRYAL